MLFEEDRHEALVEKVWNSELILATVRDIYERALVNFNPCLESAKTFYDGAAGVLWALDEVAKFLGESLPFDKTTLVGNIYQDYLRAPDTGEVVPSLFLGETGILLLKYKFNPLESDADRLYTIIEENIPNQTLESLWGASGTMVGASFMYQCTRESRWAKLFLKNVDFLIQELKASEERDERIWTQDMYGKQVQYIGAGHGYFGNIFGILKELPLLSEADKKFVLEHACKFLKESAYVEGNAANWKALYGERLPNKMLVQWCHGSPGIITSLRSFPLNYDPEFEELLIKAGEAVWLAGPLKKGAVLCHGTDGNGYAFLQLYKRSGNKLWLERARQFALHALDQRNGIFSLFTGELGLAVFLIACMKEDDHFPLLDYL